MITAVDLLDRKCRRRDTGLNNLEIQDRVAAIDGWKQLFA